MKKLFLLIVLLSLQKIVAQNFSTRFFPQPLPPATYSYSGCNFSLINKTTDGGFIFAYNPYSPGIHVPYPVDYYTIKTDSFLIPKWKKPFFSNSFVLPTGGIILYYEVLKYTSSAKTIIEKIDNAGNQIWIKEINSAIITDQHLMGNSLKLIGATYSINPFTSFEVYTPLVLDLDTSNANIIAQKNINILNQANDYFSHIYKDGLNNFYITSIKGALLKFDAAFNLLWTKNIKVNGNTFYINDIKVLPSNDQLFIGSASNPNLPYAALSFFKFDPVSNNSFGIIANDNVFPGNFEFSNTNRLIGAYWHKTQNTFDIDTLNIISIDTSLNVLSNTKQLKGMCSGAIKRVNSNKYLVSVFGKEPSLSVIDSMGYNSCGGVPASVPFVNSILTVTASSATITNSNFSLLTSTINAIATQNFYDNCNIILNLNENKNHNSEINTFPNPANEQITISFTSENSFEKILIYNSTGQLIREENIILNNKKIVINIKDLPNGIYFLQAANNNAANLISKFVIAH